MRVKLTALLALGALSLVPPAYAGNGSGYSQSREMGVSVYRGHHGPLVTELDLRIEAQEQRAKMRARKAEQKAALNSRLEAQSAQIARLSETIENLEQAQNQPQQRRRRTYYGNPPFFGSNGFIGNRFHGGGTIIDRSTRRRGYPNPRRRGNTRRHK